MADSEAELDGFLAKFEPEVATQAHSLIGRMRARIPGAQVLVYDNYNALAIGFGPSDKAGQAVLSLAVMPRWVTLCFLYGAGLPDPHNLLNGSGSRVRHIRLHTPEAFDDAPVQALVQAALDRSEPPIDAAREQKLII